MAQLLAKQKTHVVPLHRGDAIKGTITKLTKSEILVDVNAKSEAVVLERDKKLLNRMLSSLKEGDEVTVTVLNPESDTGSPLVSLRRFIEENSWQELTELQKKGEQLEVTVLEVTKGGYVVGIENGLAGFLPFSHASYREGQQLTSGTTTQATILEMTREDNKIIFSQKNTFTDGEFAAVMKQFPRGQKMSSTIANVAPFGIFVLIPINEKKTIDGLIHISEIAWEKVDDLASLYKSGDTVEAVVIGYDKEAKRIDLSVKQLTADPFEEIMKQFPVDKKVSGTVSKISGGNVYVSLAEGIEGVIRKEKVPPTVTYTEGQAINITVSDIDKRRHRIELAPVLLEKPLGYR